MDHWDQESSTLTEIKTNVHAAIPTDESKQILSSFVHTQVPSALSTGFLSRLKSEIEATQDASLKALILHELGVLEERVTHDELGAAREYLTAFNTDSNFQESLESLIRILERRRSLKNLGRVLDSLIKIASSPEQKAKALRARANDEIVTHHNRERAREFLEQAVEVTPEDATAWLMLEIEAALRADDEERMRAFTHRIALSQDARWAGLLRIDLAEMRAADGDIEDALDVLTEVISSPCTEAWRACEAAERLAYTHQLKSREAWALMQRGEIVLESLSEPIRARGEGVSVSLRSVGVAVDAFMRAAVLYRSLGRIEDEAEALERACFADPNAITPRLSRLNVVHRLHDYERVERLARELIANHIRAEFAPTLWLSMLEAALFERDRAKLTEISTQLLENSIVRAKRTHATPQAFVAYALQRDLILNDSDFASIAEALEHEAQKIQNTQSKAQGYVYAALIGALLAHDITSARTACEHADQLGFDPFSLSHLKRVLATLSQDQYDAKASSINWYKAATSQLQASLHDETKKHELSLDLVRFDLQRRAVHSALETLYTVEKDPTYGLFARLFSIALSNHSIEDTALCQLPFVDNVESQAALNLARIVYAIRKHDAAAHQAAVQAFSTYADHDIVAALVHAFSVRAEQPAHAARRLETLVEKLDSSQARDIVRVASSLLYAQSGAIQNSVDVLNSLETEVSTNLKATQSAWLRYASKNYEANRAEILSSFRQDALNVTEWSTLECVVYALSHASSDFEPKGLLNQLCAFKHSTLRYAGLLIQAMWPDDRISAQEKKSAQEALIKIDPEVERWVHRFRMTHAQASGNIEAAYSAAQAWFQAKGGVAAALEMLLNATDLRKEIEAQVALASTLNENDKYKVLSGAALLAQVANAAAPNYVPERNEGLDSQTTQSVALTLLEWAAPGSNPGRRSQALSQVADVVDEEANTLLEMAAWSALAQKDFQRSRQLFEKAIERGKALDHSVRLALEGLVEVEFTASQGSPTVSWACAVEQLAEYIETSGDSQAAATLWEQVGHAWWNFLDDAARGERALTKSFFLDHKRKTAFERVFRAIRARKEDDQLLLIVGIRLKATNDPIEMAKLFWEQARVLRAKGERDEALNALENVTLLEPDHVGALALSAEIYISRQMFAEAALALERLAQQNVPAPQKLGAGLGAADVYETKLNRYDKALDILLSLDQVGLGDLNLHERIVRAATQIQTWNVVSNYLQLLIKERAESQGRIAAARELAMVCRVHLNDEASAANALITLLTEAPTDLDALEQLLQLNINLREKIDVFESSLQALRTQLQVAPAEVRSAQIVSKLALEVKQDDLAYRALGVLRVLKALDSQTQLQAWYARLSSVPTVAINATSMQKLIDPEDTDSVYQLLRLIAPALVEAFGPTLESLNVGRRERVDVRSGNALRNEIAAWAGAFGLMEWELYISEKQPHVIQGIPSETPAFVVGSAIQAPLSLEHRVRVVREIFGILRGTTIVQVRDDVALAAIVVASCEIAEIKLRTPAYSVLAETQRLLGKAISRKIKKALPQVAQSIAQQFRETQDLRSIHAAALRSLDRVSAIAVGDAALILKESSSAAYFANIYVEDPRIQSLLRFVWSDDCFLVRKQLGLAIG